MKKTEKGSPELLRAFEVLEQVPAAPIPTPPVPSAAEGMPEWVVCCNCYRVTRNNEGHSSCRHVPATEGARSVAYRLNEMERFYRDALAQAQRERDKERQRSDELLDTLKIANQTGDLRGEEIQRLRAQLAAKSPVIEAALAWERTGDLDVPLEQNVDAITALGRAVRTYRSTPSPAPAPQEDYHQLVREIAAWANATFPQATNSSRAAHLRSEATELCNDPHDLEEMADIFMLLVQCAGSSQALLDAARRKLEINKTREWGARNAEGFVEHVRSAPQEEGQG